MAGNKVPQCGKEFAGMLRAVLGKCRSNIVDDHATNLVFAAIGLQQVVGKCGRCNFRNLLVYGDRGQLALVQAAKKAGSRGREF
jgi:hypothetical protein